MKLSKWMDITGLYPSFNFNKLVYLFASWRSHKKEKNAYKVYYITKAHEYEKKQFSFPLIDQDLLTLKQQTYGSEL